LSKKADLLRCEVDYSVEQSVELVSVSIKMLTDTFNENCQSGQGVRGVTEPLDEAESPSPPVRRDANVLTLAGFTSICGARIRGFRVVRCGHGSVLHADQVEVGLCRALLTLLKMKLCGRSS
jgi:hypothetical protein